MAGFTDTSDLSKLKMDAKTTLKASDIRVQDFSFEGKGRSAGTDILDFVTQAAREAARPQASVGLKLDAFDVDFSGLAASLGDEGPEGPLLREAKRQIADEQYPAALQKLREVFAFDENHHEGIYLQAFCEHKLNKPTLALKSLQRLNDALLSNRLRTRVQNLKLEIRQSILPRVARLYAEAVKSRDAEKAIRMLSQLVEDDPAVGRYHYYLAGALVVGKRMEEALGAASAGLAVCESDKDELENFRRQIESRFIPGQLAPARDLFRERNYQAARENLQGLPEECRRSSLWMTFDGYLERLCGKGGGLLARFMSAKPDKIDPPGSPAEVEALCEFLIERELKVARAAVDQEDYRKAERALEASLNHVPRYPLANHLYATCVYRRVGADVRARIGTDIDQAAADTLRGCRTALGQAREHAEIGRRDAELKDAPRLLKSIDEMCQQIDGVVREFESRQHDARLVNQAIDDFIGILVSIITLQSHAHNAYQLRQEVQSLHSGLQGMSSKLPKLKRQCVGNEAREIMDVLQQFVDNNLRALRQAMGL